MENDNNLQKSVERLKAAQEGLHREIYTLAKSAGLSNDEVEPIVDGVYDMAAYLSSTKIMWILKEPYDDFKDGKSHTAEAGNCTELLTTATHGRTGRGSR